MTIARTVAVVHDTSGRIKCILGTGDIVSRVELPKSFVSGESDLVSDQLSSRYVVYMDSSGPTLMPLSKAIPRS